MTEAIRVLHVFGTTNLGGAESRIMDLYRSIDRSKVQFDFVTHANQEGYFDKEVLELGGRIFHVPPFRVYNVFSYKRAFKELFSMHPEFQAVHGHMTSTASIYLPIAKKMGVPRTIAHARSAGVDRGIKGWITRKLRKNLSKKADVLLACSKLAGQAVFGEKAWNDGRVKFVPNAINTAKYRYSESIRKQVRSNLDLNDRIVIGHVGSFRYAKNHEYLLKIFSEIRKISAHTNHNPILLLLGDGELMETIKQQAEQLGLKNSVLFLGNRDEIWRYYQAMDYVVFPSHYEGMPGTIVEAQTAGLRCLISDRVSTDTVFTDLVKQKSIDIDPAIWAEEITDTWNYERKDMCVTAVNAGFDVADQAGRMVKLYETGVWNE